MTSNERYLHAKQSIFQNNLFKTTLSYSYKIEYQLPAVIAND